MDEALCAHGLSISELENNSGTNTYCEACVCEAIFNGSLGIYMGITPTVKRQMRNKAKAKRRKERLHG